MPFVFVQIFLHEIFPNLSAQIIAEYTTLMRSSRGDIKLMLAMMDDPFCAKEIAEGIRSVDHLLALIDKVPSNRFTSTSLARPQYPDFYGDLELHHLDIVELVKDMLLDSRFQGHIHLEPQKDVRAGTRYVSEYVSGTHYENMYNVYADSGAYVCAVGLVSDATVISMSGSLSVHPMYCFLYNVSSVVRWKKGGVRLCALLPSIPGTPPQKRTDQHVKDRREVFHAAITVIVRRLETAGAVRYFDHAGIRRIVYMHLVAYLGDYPEICKVCLCYEGVNAQIPCNNCTCPTHKLQDVEEQWPRRTKQQAIALLRRMAEMLRDTSRGSVGRLQAFCDKWSMHPGVPFWLHTPFFDPFMMPPERLHALDSGLVSWFVICLVTLIRLAYKGNSGEIHRRISEFDWRFQNIPRFPTLRIFKQGVSRCAKYTAGEWVDMLKVLVFIVPGLFPKELEITSLCVKLCEWYMELRRPTMSEAQRVAALKKLVTFKTHCVRAFKIILDKGRTGTVHTMKFHVQCHFLDYVMHLGLPDEFCVQEAEHAHVDLKATAQLTNNRHDSFTRQMLNVVDRENAMARYAPREAALRVHPSHEGAGAQRVMAKTTTKFSLLYDDLSETGVSSEEKGLLCSILDRFLHKNRKVQVGATIRVFKTMTLPVSREFVEFGGPARVDTIRADPSYNRAPWFSDVSIKSGRSRGDVWYAQVRLMFYVEVCTPGAASAALARGTRPHGTDVPLAFVKWFDGSKLVPDETTCTRLLWGDFDIINPESIRKEEHILPDFERDDGSFYVNKFAFIHQRRGF